MLIPQHPDPPPKMEQGRFTRSEPNPTEDMLFPFSYMSTARQESPEPLVPSTGGIARQPANVPLQHRNPFPQESYPQPSRQSSSYRDTHILVPGYLPSTFHSHGEMGSPGEQATWCSYRPQPQDTLGRVQRRPTAQSIATWLESQPLLPSDTPPVRHTSHVTAPSFRHSGLAQSHEPQHVYTAAYERSHVPAWKESQYSGEYRRQEMDARVSQADFVLVSPRAQGSQSSGSAHSFSSGGATSGSCDHSGMDVTSECEFCGRTELLSTLKGHWLSCPHRTAVPPSRRGIWIKQ